MSRQNANTKNEKPRAGANNRHAPLYEQLVGIRGSVRGRRPSNSIKDPSPNPDRWLGDGEDHINIWVNGKTDIGKLLAHGSPLSFTHKIFGRFCSLEVFWHYIQSEERDDRLRNMSGKTLTKFARKLTKRTVDNFRAIIMDSNYQRICTYPQLVAAIKESTLPFDCYIENAEGLRQRPGFFKWLLRGFEEIREAIQKDREPNFKFLLDKPNSDIYEFVVPKQRIAEVKEKKADGQPEVSALFKSVIAESKKNSAVSETGAVVLQPPKEEVVSEVVASEAESIYTEVTPSEVQLEVISVGDVEEQETKPADLAEEIRQLIHLDTEGNYTVQSAQLERFIVENGGQIGIVSIDDLQTSDGTKDIAQTNVQEDDTQL